MKFKILSWLPILNNPIPFLVIGIFLITFLIIIFSFLLYFYQQQKKHRLAIQQRIHHYLVYRINLKLDVVYEFDPKHPGKEKILQVSQFLKRFSAIESEKIYKWWEKLLTSKLDTSWILTSKTIRKNNFIYEYFNLFI